MCIIFRPDKVNLSGGSCYRVSIVGVQTRDGKDAKIEYLVEFTRYGYRGLGSPPDRPTPGSTRASMFMVQNFTCHTTGDAGLLKLTDRRLPFFSWRTGIAFPPVEAVGVEAAAAPGGRWMKSV